MMKGRICHRSVSDHTRLPPRRWVQTMTTYGIGLDGRQICGPKPRFGSSVLRGAREGEGTEGGAIREARGERMRIRRMEERDLPTVDAWVCAEGWRPAHKDMDTYYAADPRGLWVLVSEGEVADQEEIIGIIGTMRWGSRYGHIGLFIVAEAERGKGYGKQLWSHAVKDLDGVEAVGLDAVPSKVPMYQKFGFSPAYTVRFFSATANQVQQASHAMLNKADTQRNEKSTILELGGYLAQQGRWTDIIEFDARFFPCERPSLLRGCLEQEGVSTIIALAPNSNRIVGIARSRRARDADNGQDVDPRPAVYRIAPMCAETLEVASSLIHDIGTRLLNGSASTSQGPGQDLLVTIDAPSSNVAGCEWASNLGMSETPNWCERMYRGPAPTVDIGGVYSFAGLEFG